MSATATENITPSAEEQVVETITKLADSQTKINERLDAFEEKIEKASKVNYPNGMPNGFGIRKGEDPLSSRPFSMMRLAKALRMKKDGRGEWNENAKVEIDLSDRLRKNGYGAASWDGFGSGFMVPLGAELMPTEDHYDEAGKLISKGMSRDFVDECSQIMKIGGAVDFDSLEYDLRKAGVTLAKDMSAFTATQGGTLVGLAAQGELIELLRAVEFFSQVGSWMIDLPAQGKVRFPRITSSLTIAATSESASVSESTPGTGALELSAKPYTGLTDIPDELLRFSTSVAVEAWLRSEFIREIALKADRDMIYGAGGTSIRGIVNYAGISTVVASTTGVNGDTLAPEDPARLFANIADNNAPVDRGFFYGMTNTLWAGISTRKASTSGEFMFNIATQTVGGGRPRKTLNGETVVCSTQIPTNRTKGGGTTLTLLLAGVPSEWIIARAGVVEVDMTNSDSTKFQNRISTLRGTQYVDAGPRHEASFGIIDTLLNA